MICTIPLYMHLVQYTLQTRSFFFSKTYSNSGIMKITVQNTRARRAAQLEVLSIQHFFYIDSFIHRKKIIRKKD